MNASDAVNGREGVVYATIDGNRYPVAELRSFKFNLENEKAEVPILGKRMMGHKIVGLKGTFEMSVYSVTSKWEYVTDEYKKNGKSPYFEIQATVEDPTSTVGRKSYKFFDCLLDDVDLLSGDATSSDVTSEDVNGTFDDYVLVETYDMEV